MIPRWLLALCAVCLLEAPVHTQSPAKPRLDGLGDPLPNGAVARLGTLRFKHAPTMGIDVRAAVFSPDGKRFASLDETSLNLCLWDTASGRELRGPWTSSNRCTAAAFSPDGLSLAASADRFPGGNQPKVIIYNIPRATQAKTFTGPRLFPSALVFADKGKSLVLAGRGTVSWWNVATDKEKQSWKPFADEKQPVEGGGTKTKVFDHCALSPDAKSIAVHVNWIYDQPRVQPFRGDSFDHEAIGFDLATRKMTWRTVGNYNYSHKSHFAYSADGKRIAIAMGPDRVEVRNAHTGKLIAMPLERRFTGTKLIDSLALSSDGRTAALAGEDTNVILWNTDAPGTPRKFVARNWPFSAHCLQFAPDDKMLLVGIHTDLQLYDVATLKEVHPWEGHRDGIDFLAFTRDSKRLLTGSDAQKLQLQEVAAWDAATWKLLRRTAVRTPPWPNLGSVSPEQSAYVGKTGDDRFALYAMTSGKLLARFEVPRKQPGEARGFFSPSGKLYVLDRQDNAGKNVEGLYAVPSGKLICLLPPLPTRNSNIQIDLQSARPIAFSSDDRLVALISQEDGKIHICDTPTGKLAQRLGAGWDSQGDQRQRQIELYYFAGNLAFSQDGKFLASWTNVDNMIHVWDAASGNESQRIIPEQPARLSGNFAPILRRVHFAWSPDNRVLAVGEDNIQLWELATGSVRRHWMGHEGSAIRGLAYSPNSRFLASGSADTTVLIWDLSLLDRAGLPSQAIGPGELATRWQTLAQNDAGKAFRTIRDLTAAPAESVAWIKDHLKPARSVEAKHIEDLIAQLDDTRFKVRQQASADLLQIGERVGPAIDKALAGNPALETRRRLEELRTRIGSPILKGERLQEFRAVEVLERIGTPEARQVLQALAEGAAGALVTTQAREALARLRRN